MKYLWMFGMLMLLFVQNVPAQQSDTILCFGG